MIFLSRIPSLELVNRICLGTTLGGSKPKQTYFYCLAVGVLTKVWLRNMFGDDSPRGVNLYKHITVDHLFT